MKTNKPKANRRANDLNHQTHARRLLEEGDAFTQLGAQKLASTRESFDVVVIGAGQAGLSVGYFLQQRGLRFVILDASDRIGDAWRKRWDSLRLFTPARYDGLVGMPFPAPPDSFPTKDEMADYLEAYATRFELPVRTGTRVERLGKNPDGRYVVQTSDHEIEADQVVIAMANYQRPRVPSFARELDPSIVQIHSHAYKHPSQLRDGDVLIVGAGNSGAEIAAELSRSRRVWLSGRDTGQIPFRISGLLGRLLLVQLVLKVLFHRVLSIKTPIGRKARPKLTSQGGPLIRTKIKQLVAMGVERAPRTGGVEGGLPQLEDGRVLDVTNVIWCTGYHPGFSWIDLPVFDDRGRPRHEGGVVHEEPGLYFVGLHFLFALSSAMVHGVGRDAERIVDTLARRAARPHASSPSSEGASRPRQSSVSNRAARVAVVSR